LECFVLKSTAAEMVKMVVSRQVGIDAANWKLSDELFSTWKQNARGLLQDLEVLKVKPNVCLLDLETIMKRASRPVARPASARRNQASESTYAHDALDKPFAQGAFRLVGKGLYVKGLRAGEACVVKWFKSGSVFEASFFAHDMEVVRKSLELIELWNAESINFISLNTPEVWTFTKGSREGQKCLVEPFIENWVKFNSNTGWSGQKVSQASDSSWSNVLQALSHFSYHKSGGAVLLCDLQGGFTDEGVVLSDPVIMSHVAEQYGPTDLGSKGISTFFSTHKCNKYCGANWSKPQDVRAYYIPQEGSAMMSASIASIPQLAASMKKLSMSAIVEENEEEY
jgi:hypothetical protein